MDRGDREGHQLHIITVAQADRAVHGDLGNPYTLWTAAQAVFEQGQGASS
jgi:hypothetical protein